MYAAGLSFHSKHPISSFSNISTQKFCNCFYEEYIIVSERTFNSLPYAYQCALVKLSKLISKSSNLEAQRELFESFSKKFTLHVEILRAWKDLETQEIHPDDIEHLEDRETFINIKATQHLYDDRFLNFSFAKPHQFPVLNKVLTAFTFNGNFETDVYNFLEVNENVKISLTFPNQHLQAFWKYYLKHSLSPIPSALGIQYQRALILYEKILAVKHNKRQWIRFMKEANDHDFVVQNVEASLGRNPFNKDAWREYIEYLRKIDYKATLDVHRRCCHFFVGDWEIRAAYRKEIQKQNKKGKNVAEWAKDYKNLMIDFPVAVSNDFAMDQVMTTLMESASKVIKNPFKRLKPKRRIKETKFLAFEDDEEEESSSQDPLNPVFRAPMLNYISKNGNQKTLTKLYSISKRFYQRSRIALCHRFSVTDTPKTVSFEASLFVSQKDLDYNGLRNIFVTNALIAVSHDSLALSNVMPIIFKSDPAFIDIKNQIITFEDYCLLVSGGNVANICFDGVTVTREDGSMVTVDYLIEKLPNIKSIKFGSGTVIDKFSSGRLGDLKLKTLIDNFEIHELDEKFEVFGFSDFIKNNATSSTHFSLNYKNGTEASVKSNFRCNLFFITESWIPRFTTPYLSIA